MGGGVALAGSIAVESVLGEPTIFSIADIRTAHRLAGKMVFYYGGWGAWTSGWKFCHKRGMLIPQRMNFVLNF